MKQKIKTPRLDANWDISEEMTINGRKVFPGTELKISGVRGRFRFIKHVNTGEAEWIDVWGGTKGSENWRSFRVDRVQTVHYKNKTVENLAVQYKEKRKLLKAS